MANDETLLRTLLLIVAVVLLVPFLMMVLAWPMMGLWGGGHMWDGNATGAGWMTMILLWLLPLAVVLGLGYLLYRGLVGSGGRETDPALEELRVAYARGELSDEEFEERRNRLRRRE